MRTGVLAILCALMFGTVAVEGAGQKAQKRAEKKEPKAPVIAPSARAVIEKAVESMGGDAALAGVRSMRMQSRGTYRIGSADMPYTTDLIYGAPGRLVWKLDAGDFKGGMGIRGNVTWTAMMAPPARADGIQKECVRDWLFMMKVNLVRPLLDLPGATITGGEAEERDGATVHRLTVVVPPKRTFVLTFSGGEKVFLAAMEGETYFLDGRQGTFTAKCSSPKQFGDVTLPAVSESQTFFGGKLEETIREEVTAIEWNPRVSRDAFDVPPLPFELMKPGTKTAPEFSGLKVVHRGEYSGMTQAIAKLMTACREAKGMQAGAIAVTYLNDPGQVKDPAELTSEIVLPVEFMGPQPAKLPDGIAAAKVPAVEVAAIMARGAYGKADVEAMGKLFAWMVEQKLTPAGPPRMLYYHDPAGTLDEDELSEVQVPIAKK